MRRLLCFSLLPAMTLIAAMSLITVIKGNPLFDIMALANVDIVIKDGVPYRDSTRVDVAKQVR
jgi:hypothetical protein